MIAPFPEPVVFEIPKTTARVHENVASIAKLVGAYSKESPVQIFAGVVKSLVNVGISTIVIG